MKMFYTTSDKGLVETKSQTLTSKNPKEVADFFKGNFTTAGFSINFAANPETREVVEIFKKGKLVQRDVKPLIAAGFSEWLYDWAFACKNFEVAGEHVKLTRTIDLTTLKDVAPWARALGVI